MGVMGRTVSSDGYIEASPLGPLCEPPFGKSVVADSISEGENSSQRVCLQATGCWVCSGAGRGVEVRESHIGILWLEERNKLQW